MSIAQKLEATLNTSNTSNIIVAYPEGSTTKKDPTFAEYLQTLTVPVGISDLVYGCKSKLNQPLYQQSFLDKCSAFGDKISFAFI